MGGVGHGGATGTGTVGSMSEHSRARLLQLVRRNDADLAETALLCAVEADPDLDVDAELLRIDALADALRTRGFVSLDANRAALDLAAYLGREQGFTGDVDDYHDPDNALLHRVLRRKRGLPISLSIVYAAVARRVDVPAFAVHLPGHVVVGIADERRPVLLDPFHGGVLLDEDAINRRIAQTTGDRIAFRRSMLRPAPAVNVARRLLNNLARDLGAADRGADALRAVELKLLLPNRLPEDHRAHGDLLLSVGRFDAAADAFERYVASTGPDAPERDETRRAAIHARARLN